MKSREKRFWKFLKNFWNPWKKVTVTFLYDATGIWTASVKFQPGMEFQKAESNPASIEAERNYGKGWNIYMEKGFKTLELIGDLDDKYIYEASRP